MERITRLPAIPLVLNDPYLSIWSAADRLTDVDTTHWAGERKRLLGEALIDGKAYRFLGLSDAAVMETVRLDVRATSTEAEYLAAGVRLTLTFTTPLLLNDPDTLSTPITFVDIAAESVDGAVHEVGVSFRVYDDICYDGLERPEMYSHTYAMDGLNVGWTGQTQQKVLCHSGDHITIDWGYLYVASACNVACEKDYIAVTAAGTLWEKTSWSLMIAYDDVASINYFGTPTKAYYARNGKTIVEAIKEFAENREELLERCAEFDDLLDDLSTERGGEDFRYITSAAYRHAIAAHKLIADANGDMVFLSKENDSNGCIGTVDVSYPSIPLFLKFNPEFVRAMCRPVLHFASLPVWHYDFAPHDVGRYPQVLGQVYASVVREKAKGEDRKRDVKNGDVYPPFYLYPETEEAYDFRYQMPVEECGNMLVMIAAAAHFDGNNDFAANWMPTLEKWVRYLIEYGEDPGEQLCTDDFAGHLARNINLSAKAVVGVACYARILKAAGRDAEAAEYDAKAKEMAASWYKRAKADDGHTWLTFDGIGWSMKYNMVWDKIMGLGLLPVEFFTEETDSYVARLNTYGLPLDSRKTYTKSDWILWVAAMAKEETFAKLIAPIVKYLRETESRVAFSDWYDTVTGKYEHFIARSVQGGLFMPLILKP